MSLFTDAKTVIINNKEVQSITLQNGGIIYEKPSEYELILTSDKSCIQTNETATLTATLTYEGEGVSGETIIFYDSESTGDIIGSDVTDSNGVATVSYTGVGTGDLNVQADWNNTVQSEIFALEDCKRYDSLTSDNHLWSSNSATILYDNSGMYISKGNWSQFYLLDVLSSNDVVEFDIIYVNLGGNTDAVLYSFLSNDTSMSVHSDEIKPKTTGHYKIVNNNGTVTVYNDNAILTTFSWSEQSYYWFIWTGGARAVTLKNLKVKSL